MEIYLQESASKQVRYSPFAGEHDLILYLDHLHALVAGLNNIGTQ